MTNKPVEHVTIESWDELDLPRLEEAMDYFGSELDTKPKNNAEKKTLSVAALAGDGITVEMYNDFLVPVAEEEEVEVEPEPTPEPVKTKRGRPSKVTVQDEVLLKMERANPHYEIYGYTFTKTHPFQVVTAEAANYIISTQEGFRTASPAEVQEYYS